MSAGLSQVKNENGLDCLSKKQPLARRKWPLNTVFRCCALIAIQLPSYLSGKSNSGHRSGDFRFFV